MTRIRTALIGLAGAAVLVLSACGNGPPPDGSDTGSGGGSSASGGGSGGGGGGALQVVTGQAAGTKVSQTDDLKFSPNASTVKSGDVVQWTNTGSTAHNVTFDQGVHSDTLNGGDVFEVKFTAAGSYHYVCTFHAGMEGTITVG